MAFDLSNLNTYVDEQRLELIRKSLLAGRTLGLVSIVPGIKHSATINLFSTDAIGANAGCGFNPSGTTIVDQRTITVCPISFAEEICPDDLESYFLQKTLRPGSLYEDMPLEAIYAEEKAAKIADVIEKLVWQGDSNTGVGNMALCDGWLKLFDDLSAVVVDGNTSSATGITAGNVIDLMDDMAAVLPVDIIDRDDLVVMCGYDVYRLYSKALRDANLFHYSSEEKQMGGDFGQPIPGTQIMVIPTKGLNGTNRMVLTYAENLVVGTDLTNDFEDFKIWWSEDNQIARFLAKMKLGVEVRYPDFVVNFELV